MTKLTLLPAFLVSITIAISGCGSSPNAKFYILNSLDQNEVLLNRSKLSKNIVVKVGPVSIPDTLDQSQIVSRNGKTMLILDEYNRWGGDFQSNIQQTIGENISILLPTQRVILSQEMTLLPVDYLVVVNIRSFEGTLGGLVTLNADWTVVSNSKAIKKKALGKKSVLYEQTEAAGYQAYVSAHSRLLAKLSQEITDAINSLNAQ